MSLRIRHKTERKKKQFIVKIDEYKNRIGFNDKIFFINHLNLYFVI